MASSSSNNADNKEASGTHTKMLALFIGIAGVVCGFVVVMFMFGLSCEHSAVVVGFIVAQGALVALALISAMLALCVMKPSVFNAYFVLQACAIVSFMVLMLWIPHQRCGFIRGYTRIVLVVVYLVGSFACCRAVWLAKYFMKAGLRKPTVEVV